MTIKADWLPGFLKRWILRRTLEQVRKYAATVHDNKQFRDIILAVQPGMRKAVYAQLAPMLSFKAKPYILLIK